MGYRLLYNLLIHLGLPLALLALYKPKKGKPGFGKRWAEHLGLTPATGQEAPLWIHAVSVGETLAISPFIRALKAERPFLPILLTTTTRTGAEQAARLGELVEHRYAPLDYPWAVAAFLKAVKPRALWVMETELWPNWLAACEARHLPVTIINARLSERSCRRYARFQGAFDALSRPLTHLLCQHQDDADRFHRLGIDRSRLAVTGSIKFDIQIDEQVQAKGRALRQLLGAERPVWIAASTHQGEDEQVLAAFDRVLVAQPSALLILVPRHPERFEQVAALCALRLRATHGWLCGRRARQDLPGGYHGRAAADAGGGRRGLRRRQPGQGGWPQPAGAGGARQTLPERPCLLQLQRHHPPAGGPGGAAVVADAAELGEQVSALLADESRRREMGEQARAVVLRNQGALARTLSHCLASLEND